jgi:hypothetical protein
MTVKFFSLYLFFCLVFHEISGTTNKQTTKVSNDISYDDFLLFDFSSDDTRDNENENASLMPLFEKSNRLSADDIKMMETWFKNHAKHPYPSSEDKKYFVENSNLSIQQINDWFTRERSKMKAIKRKYK